MEDEEEHEDDVEVVSVVEGFEESLSYCGKCGGPHYKSGHQSYLSG